MNVFILTLVCMTFMSVSQAHIHFVENKGQWEENVKFRANIPGAYFFYETGRFTYLLLDPVDMKTIHLNKDTVIPLNAQAVKLSFENANLDANSYGTGPQSFYHNYFRGKNPENWFVNVLVYDGVTTYDLYEGIDLEFFGGKSSLKYNLLAHSNADISQIRIKIEGHNDWYIRDNRLHILTNYGVITENQPVGFQFIDGKKKEVALKFVKSGSYVTFETVESYNKNYQLIIDPEVIFSTYSGSYADNFGYTATYENSAKAYSGGTVFEPGFPVTSGVIQMNFGGGEERGGPDVDRDVGILKYSEDGTKLIFATYLGGSGNEDPHSMVVNSKNQLIVYGNTTSSDFPVTPNAFATNLNNNIDIFASIISEDGTELIASTYIGGSGTDGRNGRYGSAFPTFFNFGDIFRGEVIIDKSDYVYIVSSSRSEDFPVTVNAFQTDYGGEQDGVIIKFNPELSDLEFASYIGGSNHDAAYGIRVDNNGFIFITGGTSSIDFPVVSNALYPDYLGGRTDAFIAKISPDGSQIINATYFGTVEYDQAYFIELDQSQNVYIAGQTSGGIPVSAGVYNNPNSGQFIAKLNNDLTEILLSTVFGAGSGKPDLSPSAFMVDECERIYYSGWGGEINRGHAENNAGYTYNLPLTSDAIQKSTNGSDFYIAVFGPDMKNLQFSSYFGGNISHDHVDGGTSRFDQKGVVYQSVCTGCPVDGVNSTSDFPTTKNAWSEVNPATRPGRPDLGGCNNALFKIDLSTKADFSYTIDSCAKKVSFVSESQNVISLLWDFGDGALSEENNPVHQYATSGTYTVKLIVNPYTACADTVIKILSFDIVLIEDLIIPNIFTPNDDDHNDLFFIKNLEHAKCFEVEFFVFNRWGNLVFKTTDYIEWDGRVKENFLEPGSYFYILKSGDYERSGTVTIVR